jgi:5-methyltetrahydrofolate--homocysteine methyltransferase
MMKKKIVILDGAMGTNLLTKGRKPGESPSLLNIRNAEAVLNLQRDYVESGSDIILTNTFGADALHFSSRDLEKIVYEGVRIAKEAAKGRALIWADVSTLGELIKPFGTLDFFEAKKIYSNTIKKFIKFGIKHIFLETFTSLIDAKAAFLAAREYTEDIFVSFAFEENGKTLMGDCPESIAVIFESLGAKGVGVNCTHPEIATEVVMRMAFYTSIPLIAKPNAGKVEIRDNEVKHTLSDDELANYFSRLQQAGANIIGGCCGTSPRFIKLIANRQAVPNNRKEKRLFLIASPSKLIDMTSEGICVVGERMNPAGNKRIKEALAKGDYSVYATEAREQELKGANALDICAFSIEKNEPESLINAIYEAIKVSSLPLFIDTKDMEAAEAAMALYPGIGVLNSVPADKNEMRKWFPIIKKYGFKVVISLLGRKLPKSEKDRIKYFWRAIYSAAELNFPIRDLIFDPLVLSAATDKKQIYETLKALSYIHQIGHLTILGISNISFGLPNRANLNAALIPAAVYSGVNFVIINPFSEEVMLMLDSACRLFRDKRLFELLEKPEIKSIEAAGDSKEELRNALLCGDASKAIELSKKLINDGVKPNEIIDECIAKSLQTAGMYYQEGKYFIPDLLLAAEAAKMCLEVIRPYLPKTNKKGKVILATVKGDIHDVGKNIVGAVLESAGYEIIDLGKNVAATRIVKAVKDYQPDFLGLSALLTTTMPEMEIVIKLLRREKLDVRVIIGGPNVSSEYAKRIGAYGAARNIAEGLKLFE